MDLHPSIRERLDRLTPDQRAAVTAPPGPVLCVAPAGSGKTTTLVARLALRIASGVPPDAVCAVTFNKRAADELAGRLDAAVEPLGVSSGTVRVRTFHALGREILSDAGVGVGRLVDRATLIAELAGRPVGGTRLRALDDAFSRLRLDPESDAARSTPPAIAERYREYRAALAARGALDFDDLVAGALERLRSDGALLARWRARTRVLCIDEVQDLDRSQLELGLLLCQPGADIFLVGDDDQTIYAWRLADVRRVLALAERIPGLRRVDLVTNHRCPAPVVRRSVRLIEHGQERFAKRIEPSPRAAGSLALAPDPGDPLARARRLLDRWYAREEGRYAVLARTNAELAPFSALAVERSIPFAASDDGLALDVPAIDAVLAGLPDGPGWRGELATAGMGSERRAAEAARTVLAWAAPHRGAADLRAAVAAARSKRAELRVDDARLVLATVHGTKGLEFDHVAVIGLDEGTFPSRRSVDDAEDPARALEEERRLAYVAWTRARRSLLLVYDPGSPSIFLREAFDPAELGMVA